MSSLSICLYCNIFSSKIVAKAQQKRDGENAATPEQKHQHASARSFRAERRKQNFLFLLKEKMVTRAKKNCKENFA